MDAFVLVLLVAALILAVALWHKRMQRPLVVVVLSAALIACGQSETLDQKCVRLMQEARNTAAFFDKPLDVTRWVDAGCNIR